MGATKKPGLVLVTVQSDRPGEKQICSQALTAKMKELPEILQYFTGFMYGIVCSCQRNINLFNQYLLSNYYVPDTIFNSRLIAVNKINALRELIFWYVEQQMTDRLVKCK